jgi:hypothetical protein
MDERIPSIQLAMCGLILNRLRWRQNPDAAVAESNVKMIGIDYFN